MMTAFWCLQVNGGHSPGNAPLLQVRLARAPRQGGLERSELLRQVGARWRWWACRWRLSNCRCACCGRAAGRCCMFSSCFGRT